MLKLPCSLHCFSTQGARKGQSSRDTLLPPSPAFQGKTSLRFHLRLREGSSLGMKRNRWFCHVFDMLHKITCSFMSCPICICLFCIQLFLLRTTKCSWVLNSCWHLFRWAFVCALLHLFVHTHNPVWLCFHTSVPAAPLTLKHQHTFPFCLGWGTCGDSRYHWSQLRGHLSAE